MDRIGSWTCLTLAAVLMATFGCRSRGEFRFNPRKDHYETIATEIEYPDTRIGHRRDVMETPPPRTVLSLEETPSWPITLEEAVRIALENSRVMRDIGGRVLTAPLSTASVYDPAIRETDPRGGTEAALSAFDTAFTTGLFWGKNDRVLNNILLGGGVREFRQDYANFQAELTKTAATGTQFSARNVTDYDANNAFFNLFPSAYDTAFETEFRHPLLQGSGVAFNRIAGPNAQPGVYNGVLIARINTDLSLADFEASVRDLVDNVERAYWELYLAYRDLDARRAGRDAALATWRAVHRKYQVGTTDNEQEARAREQYYLFDSQVINALGGGTAGGTPTPGAGGVLAAERRLRWQMGLPASDGRLLRPAEEPTTVPVVFDWEESLQEALARRVELRKQKWVIKRRELELLAAKNFLQMRLDAVGLYRWRGFGDDLIGKSDIPNGSAAKDLFSGNHQEWQLGLQLSTPVGNRIGHTAVRNAELALSRERAIYHEQELRISHDLSEAIAERDRTYLITRSNYNGRIAAHQQMEEIRKKYEAGLSPLEFLLDAQRRAVEADSAYYRSLVDYNLAITQVYYARGALLDYYSIYLQEGPWSLAAHRSGLKQSRRFRPKLLNYTFSCPPPVSRGVYAQHMLGYEEEEPRPNAPSVGEESLPSERLPPVPQAPAYESAQRERLVR